MKRFLSIILAIMMLATLLPTAVFATEGEESTGIVIKYDVLGAVTEIGGVWEGANANKKPFTMLNWELSNGFFNFASSSGIDGIYSNTSELNYTPKVGIQVSSGDKFALEIYVPKAGTYDMKMLYGNSYAYAKTHVYVNKDVVSYAGGDKVGEYECRVENTIDYEKNRTDESQIVQLAHTFEATIEDIVFEEAGTYYVAFYSDGNYGSVGTFYLIENGTGTSNGVMSMETSIDNSRLTLDGDGTAQMTVDAIYLGDTTAAEDVSAYTVVYESSNNDVATVDATGKVTAVGVGEAEITATVTDSFGATAASKETVAVTEYGYTLEYNFARGQVTGPVSEWLDYVYGEADADKRAEIIAKASYGNITYDKSHGFYKFVDTNADVAAYKVVKRSVDENGDPTSTKVQTGETIAINDTYYPSCGIRCYSYAYQLIAGKYFAFEINVPVAGEFDVNIVYPSQTNAAYNRDSNLYISKDGVSTSESDLVGTYNIYNGTLTAGTGVVEKINTYNFEEPGKYTVTFMCTGSGATYTMFSGIILKDGGSSAVLGELNADKDTINVDENETATVTASGYLTDTAFNLFTSANIKVTEPTAATGFTYSSSNKKIATVDAETGVVTPVSEGVVTISATTPSARNALTKEITVTTNKPGEAVADTTVSVYIDALEGGTVETSLENTIDEVEIGTKVEATAKAAEGYEFAYWSNSNGAVESTNATETFTINVNTSIKAVFEKVVSESDATVPVYFYNGNRDLVEKADVEKGKTFGELTKPEVSLTGFAFSGWSVANETVINDVVRAVALYTDSETTYTVKVGEVTVASGKKYGESVTVSSNADNFVCWQLGEKVMSYEKSFTFDVYGDITLTEVTGDAVQAVPTVVLDTVDGENFLTYNVPAGYTKIEAGILFTTSGTPEIGSFYSKATEKTGSGQFTAKPYGATDTIARGYMIFRDAENNVRVIYAD